MSNERLIWGEENTKKLMVLICKHQGDNQRETFLKAARKLKSIQPKMAGSGEPNPNNPVKPFGDTKILSKAQSIITQMNKDGFTIHMPKKPSNRPAKIDYENLYAELAQAMGKDAPKRGPKPK
jgi:hypothetical protein